MQLRIVPESGVLSLDVENLCRFARPRASTAAACGGFHRSAGNADVFSPAMANTVRQNVPLSIVRPVESYSCEISGMADAVSFDGQTLCCELRCAVRGSPARRSPGDDPAFLARAMAAAYMLAETESCESIAVRITYTRESSGRGENAASWEAMFARAVLARAFEALLSRAAPFIVCEAGRLGEGRQTLSKLRFPYPRVREGQRELMEEFSRCIRRGRRLLVSAPTGIGKTMSGLYPALRALGAGRADRIFYFTAKTVTGTVAMDALRTLAEQSPHLRGIRLSAKERICPRRRAGESARGMCRHCPNQAEMGGTSYEERRDAALLKLLRSGSVYDSAEIVKIAGEHTVCPHELALDASEFCDVIVCDYGYLLDPAVRLRRYFVEERPERYVFLMDEAHNIPDRAREIYSAALSRTGFSAFAAEVLAALPDDQSLADACETVQAMFDGVDALCAANAEMEDGESRGGYCLEKTVPDFIPQAVTRLRDICTEYLRRDYENAAPLFEDMRQLLRHFAEVANLADEAFSFYAESVGDETLCRILCLDPSALLHDALSRAVSTALLSATLSPMDYYADVCGCREAERLELSSPYEEENLCLVTVDSVSTRFSQRKSSAADVAELIETVTESRMGNYIVYFPSYKYMEAVARQYLRLSPSMPVIMQKSAMSLEERRRFLRVFEKSARTGEGVVAFCVLGGIFSEGIDLSGERLIGSIIVGIGLPGISSELNILSEYYERTRESGRDYAYLYPAMNRILQAAGRVIRSEEDRGVVVLIDDRYADPGIRALFPAHWNRMQYTGDTYTLGQILERFWDSAP